MKRRCFLGGLSLLFLCVLLFTPKADAAFSDVSAHQWYFQAVSEMEEAGLFSGYPDCRFGPDEPN